MFDRAIIGPLILEARFPLINFCSFSSCDVESLVLVEPYQCVGKSQHVL